MEMDKRVAVIYAALYLEMLRYLLKTKFRRNRVGKIEIFDDFLSKEAFSTINKATKPDLISLGFSILIISPILGQTLTLETVNIVMSFLGSTNGAQTETLLSTR